MEASSSGPLKVFPSGSHLGEYGIAVSSIVFACEGQPWTSPL